MKRLGDKRGFTLIELVMIIVILGILAATAIIKYIDLAADAEEATCKGIYGHMASAYGITIASVKREPTLTEINLNVKGPTGDMTMPTSAHGATVIGYNNPGADNTILGQYRECTFDVTLVGVNVTDISNLDVHVAP